MLNLLTIPLFAVLYRARGSRLFNHTNSTTIGRLVSMGGMAFLASLYAIGDDKKMLEIVLWLWPTLFAWSTLPQDAAWSSQIGNGPYSKLKGCLLMASRQAVTIPIFLGLAYIVNGNYYWSLLGLSLWLPYVILGAIYKPMAVEWSEYLIGALIAITINLITPL